MGDVPKTSSYLRNRETGTESEKIPEPRELYFRVCTTHLSSLIRTPVAELQANKLARGSYLLLRTLEPPVTGTTESECGRTAIVVVEDHNKSQAICCLQGHVHLTFETEFNELLPVNTVFILKEPMLVACSERDFAVIVGSPSDFVVVGRSHTLSKDAEALGWREAPEEEGIELTTKWKQIGDDLFEKGKFCEAADAYLFALKNGGDEDTNILLNNKLAASFFAQECYEAAMKHSFNVLKVRPRNERALHQFGRALYELRLFKEAKNYFEVLSSASPSNNMYLNELVRCEERIREAEGNVDIHNLGRASLTNISAPIDHGNFLRGVQFRSGPGNERGVRATQDMMPGTLVLVEKPVVWISVPRSSSERSTVKFMRTAFKAVLKNPKTLGRKLYNLPGGGIQTHKKKTFCDEINELEPIVDARRLYQIIHKNIFKTKNTMVKNTPFTYQVYELASRFRHSCISNCVFLVYKDVITVRTCSPVQEGEELFLRYYGNKLFFREKQEALQRNGFTCTCMLCDLDHSEAISVHDVREQLTKNFYAQLSICASEPFCAEDMLLPIVKELDLMYSNRSSLRVFLFIVYLELAKVVDRSAEGWEGKLTLYVEKGLESVGLSIASLFDCAEEDNPKILRCILVPEMIFDYAGLLAEVESSRGHPDLVENWVKVLLFLERIYRGGSLEMLRQRLSGFRQLPTLLSQFAI